MGDNAEREGDTEKEVLPSLPCPWREKGEGEGARTSERNAKKGRFFPRFLAQESKGGEAGAITSEGENAEREGDKEKEVFPSLPCARRARGKERA